MKLHLLEIPESTSELASWLEQQIMGPNFGEFAAQLQILRNAESTESDGSSQNLDQILAESHHQVIEEGLANCTPDQLKQLLANPQTLFELQDQVFESGSQYWIEQVKSPAVNPQLLKALKTGVDNLHRAETAAKKRAASVAKSPQAVVETSTRRGFNWKMLVLTACVMLMVTVAWNKFRTPDTPTLAKWGWLADDALPATAAPADYLAQVSAGGQAWFDKDLSTSDDYIQRLRELQAGCEKLINSDHSVLATADRQWLVGKCMVWRDKFNEQLSSVEANPDDFKKYLNETNNTVDSLVNALNEKAKLV